MDQLPDELKPTIRAIVAKSSNRSFQAVKVKAKRRGDALRAALQPLTSPYEGLRSKHPRHTRRGTTPTKTITRRLTMLVEPEYIQEPFHQFALPVDAGFFSFAFIA